MVKKIKLIKNICSDIPGVRFGAAAGTIHKPCYNPIGAVSIKIGDRMLGVKPGEFEYLNEQSAGPMEEPDESDVA